MKWLKSFALISLFILFNGVPAVARSDIQLFPTVPQAQQHCSGDTVVWANTSSGIYHFSGTRWYGGTKNGAFVCQKEADQGGFRPARNSQ